MLIRQFNEFNLADQETTSHMNVMNLDVSIALEIR